MTSNNTWSNDKQFSHEYTHTTDFSSDPRTGSRLIGTGGDRFQINFSSNPFHLPIDAENISVSVDHARIVFNTKNITSANNTLTFTSPGPVAQTIVIPDGTYSLSELNEAIERGLQNLSLIPASGLVPFELYGDPSTGRTIIKVNTVDYVIDFTSPLNFGALTGFTGQVINQQVNLPKYVLSNAQATFNGVKQYIIHSDLVNQGMRQNERFEQTLAIIPIDVGVGETIIYNPRSPHCVHAGNLRGKTSQATFWLTDQNNNAVNTDGQYWSLSLTFKYKA